jgi:hypothetical protein
MGPMQYSKHTPCSYSGCMSALMPTMLTPHLVQHLVSGPRLPFTAAYFGSIALTLFFSLGVSWSLCSNPPPLCPSTPPTQPAPDPCKPLGLRNPCTRSRRSS